jgi:S1/P1 Nuclease
MNRAFAMLPVLLFVFGSQPAWSWSSEGHRTVGAIADLILEQQPAVRDRVRQILGQQNSLSDVSIWADCAKGFNYCHRSPTPEETAFTDHNPRHHSFHYTDVPIQQSQYRAGTAGTGSDDVVKVIEHAFNVLRTGTSLPGPAVLNQREALWLLVHLVGDIHQPLHVGAIYYDRECDDVVDPNVVGAGQQNFGIGSIVASTTGGGDLKISSSKSLHSYWDGNTVKGAMRLLNIRNTSIENFASAIISNPPTGWQTSGTPETWSAQWATEIMPLANGALTRVEIDDGTPVEGERELKCNWHVTLDRGYSQWANKQALNQLGKAGFRLAALIQAALGGP